MEAIGRQPDARNGIQTSALILAAFVEGIGFAALFAL
jgi:F-type H+-transporting ATPase subunit c